MIINNPLFLSTLAPNLQLKLILTPLLLRFHLAMINSKAIYTFERVDAINPFT